jgi:hypothetical protein
VGPLGLEEPVELAHAEPPEVKGLIQCALIITDDRPAVQTAWEPVPGQVVVVAMTATQQTASIPAMGGSLRKERLELMVQMARTALVEIPVRVRQEQLLAITGLAMLQQPARTEPMVLAVVVVELGEA